MPDLRRQPPPWVQQRLDDAPITCAEHAGLHYETDLSADGYRRLRWGKGFTYRTHTGDTVRSRALRRRFEALVIPPAWTDVRIAFRQDNHLQAIGRDAAGRSQYIYHPNWLAAREAAKYERVVAFGHVLPTIRGRVARDLRRDGLTSTRVLAAVVRMLETTLVRIGNDVYARENDSYGLTTLRRRHVSARDDDRVELEFEGKSAVEWHVTVEDPDVVAVLEECLETPGYRIFKYFDDEGNKQVVTSDLVNAYLAEAAGAAVSGKDFRTWAGTILAARALYELAERNPQLTGDRRLLRAVEQTAAQLGNTPAVCRASYIHPSILTLDDRALSRFASAAQSRGRALQETESLSPEETIVLEILMDATTAAAEAAE